jgi:transposase
VEPIPPAETRRALKREEEPSYQGTFTGGSQICPTAGKNRLGVITRAGDGMLRTVLVAGATAVIADMRRRGTRPWPWLKDMIARKPPKLVAIALANKLARIAWKLMVSGERYRPASAVPMPMPI